MIIISVFFCNGTFVRCRRKLRRDQEGDRSHPRQADYSGHRPVLQGEKVIVSLGSSRRTIQARIYTVRVPAMVRVESLGTYPHYRGDPDCT